MKKTDPEIRAEVIAWCDQFRLKHGYQCPLRAGVLHRKKDGRYRLRIGQIDIHLDDDADQIDFESAHALLGLSERDAVEAMKKELQKTNILANESIHAREVHIRKITSEFEARLNMMDAKQGKYMGLYRDSEASVTKLLEAAKAVISESEKEYAVTTMSEVAMLSDGFEQAIANLDAVLSELEKGGAGE